MQEALMAETASLLRRLHLICFRLTVGLCYLMWIGSVALQRDVDYCALSGLIVKRFKTRISHVPRAAIIVGALLMAWLGSLTFVICLQGLPGFGVSTY